MSSNFNGNMTTCPRLIFYDNLLSPNLRQPIGDDTGTDIRSTTRRESDQ
jgi:hypothetical protein